MSSRPTRINLEDDGSDGFSKKQLKKLKREGIQPVVVIGESENKPVDFNTLISASNTLLANIQTLLGRFGFSAGAGGEAIQGVYLSALTLTGSFRRLKMDDSASGALFVSPKIGGVGQFGYHSLVTVVNGEAKVSLAGGAIGDGSKSVTTAGTAEPLVGASVPCKKVWIQADGNNTGDIFIGGSTVDNTRGIHLEIHQANKAHNILEIEIDDLQKIFVDAENNGEGVTFTYVT